MEVASGNNVDGEEKDAIDAAHEEIMEGDEAGALELENAEATLERPCKETLGVNELVQDELVTGMGGSQNVYTRALSSFTKVMTPRAARVDTHVEDEHGRQVLCEIGPNKESLTVSEVQCFCTVQPHHQHGGHPQLCPIPSASDLILSPTSN